jgi:hypothetical protein
MQPALPVTTYHGSTAHWIVPNLVVHYVESLSDWQFQLHRKPWRRAVLCLLTTVHCWTHRQFSTQHALGTMCMPAIVPHLSNVFEAIVNVDLVEG